MSMKVINDRKARELTPQEITLIRHLKSWYNDKTIDYIITKLVIYGWPQNYSYAKQCIRYDTFCYNYAVGIKCNDECKRSHDDNCCIKKLYPNGNGNGNGKKNVNINEKRRAFYLSFYLFKYCGFRNSSVFRPILKDFDKKIKKDNDYKSLLVKYNKNWFINVPVINKNRVYTRKGFEFDENGNRCEIKINSNDLMRMDYGVNYGYGVDTGNFNDCKTDVTDVTEWCDRSEKTNDSCDTVLSLFSNDFYEDWEYVMECNNGDFYFSV